jgi:hypothetical protein
MAEKGGGFGSIPGDLFNLLIQYYANTPPLPALLEALRLPTLVQLAKTEHAAANADKDPYGVDVVFKCISIQSDFVTAQDAALPVPVRQQAMTSIMTTLHGLELLWV